MEEKGLLSAYLLYYWPVSYQQISHIFRTLSSPAASDFIKTSFNRKKTLSVLDIGCGPGPAASAACDFLTGPLGLKEDDISVFLADYSEKALSLARTVFSRDFPPVNTKICACDLEKNFLKHIVSQTKSRFSILLISHSLNELWKKDGKRIEKRAALIEDILDSCMEDESLIILCEPAQTNSSRELIAVRDRLLASRNDLRILSPCLRSDSPCPALLQTEGTTCHFEESWEVVEPASSLAKAANLDRNSVKMAYFVLRKSARTSKDETSVTEDEGNLSNNISFTARVVSDAMLNKAGRTRFVLCDGRRRFSLSAKKGEKAADECGFWNLRRGQLISVTGAEARGEQGSPSFAVKDGTKLEIRS